MVYLIHFDDKLHHAQHYLGFTESETMEQRIARHRSGSGAKILRACNEAGISYEVVKTWPAGTRDFERSLKKRKCARKMCPVCNQSSNKKQS